MTTVATGIERILSMLQSGNRELVNTLSAAISDTSTTTFTVTYPLRGIQLGATVAIDTELMYVATEPDEATKTVTVIRGYGGSTAATHSNGAQVVVNPKFPRGDIFNAINSSLDALSSEGLYTMKTVDLTYTGNTVAYDLTSVTSVSDVYEIRYKTLGSTKEWMHVPQSEWHLQRHASTSDFASGFALVVDGYVDQGQTLRVVYKAPFTQATATSDDLQTACLLPSTANELLYVDAAISLVYPREVKRNFTDSQGDTRRAGEVPPGAVGGSAARWEAKRARLLAGEKRVLARKYPQVRY